MNTSVINQDTRLSYFRANLSKERSKSSLLKRIAGGDNSAVNECLDSYGNKLWSLAANFVSEKHIESVTRKIFLDIWKNAKNFETKNLSEEEFIKLLAVRRIMKFKNSN